MALKDWKIITSGKYGILFGKKKSYDQIDIATQDGGFWIAKNKTEKWRVYHNTAEFETSYFKTKSQALKFAKAYMRKH